MKSIKLKIFPFVLILFILHCVNAQDVYLLGTQGKQEAVSDYCRIYDDGGKDSPHAKRVYSAVYTITAPEESARFRVIYHININNNANKAKIEILDGDETSLKYLTAGQLTGQKQGRVYSSTNKVTVRFTADDDNPSEGFDILLTACNCISPEETHSKMIAPGKIQLWWSPAVSGVTWSVDYALYCPDNMLKSWLADETKYQTLTTSDTSVIIDVPIENDLSDNICYDVYGSCSTEPIACGVMNTGTECFALIPDSVKIDTAQGVAYFDWYYPQDGITWFYHTNLDGGVVHSGTSKHFECPIGQANHITFAVTADTTLDEADFCLFLSASMAFKEPCLAVIPDSVVADTANGKVKISWPQDYDNTKWYVKYKGKEYELNAPYFEADLDCYEFTIFIVGDTVNQTDKDKLWCDSYFYAYQFNYPCGIPLTVKATDIQATSATVHWIRNDSDIDTYLVECYNGNLLVYSAVVSNAEDTAVIKGLENFTQYTVKVYALCNDGQYSCERSAQFRTAYDDCLNFTDFSSANASIKYGTYENPYIYTEPVASTAHHKVMDKQGVTDANTPLITVPEGEKASVRLGNSDIGAQAESAVYKYFADTNNYDMLILKYAIVLQDPNPPHDKTNQPRFTLEILDSSGNMIDTACGFADFYAAGDLGWNTVEGASNIIWKDWTTIGVDLSPYHGQFVQIRLTTYDCKDGGHFGYAYYNITCSNKRIYSVNRCDALDSVHLVAPIGFEYRWVKENEVDTISYDREITVVPDNSVYYCYMNFIGKSECSFTLSGTAMLIKPKAAFTYWVDTCKSLVHFTACPYVDYDPTLNIPVKQYIEKNVWNDGQGNEYTGNDFTLVISKNKTYHITLYSYLSDSYCYDSLQTDIAVDFNVITSVQGPDSICSGEEIILVAKSPHDNVTFRWNNGLNADTLKTVAKEGDSLYSVTAYVNGKCKGTAYKTVRVRPSYSDTVNASVCEGESFEYGGIAYYQSGTFVQQYTTVYGCDSTTIINLSLMPSYHDTIVAVTCGEDYTEHNFNASQSGIYTQELTTYDNGCDSIITLEFTKTEPYTDTIEQQILKGGTYAENGFNESESGIYTLTLSDIYGCDSVTVLNLEVIDIVFPAVITPNGDGINDIFEVYGLLNQQLFESLVLRIYNRYGKMIYNNSSFSTKADFWDPDATNTPTGTYFYRFTAKSKVKNIDFTGSVEVIR